MINTQERQTITVKQAAKIMGISHISLYKAIKDGEFTSIIRLGRRILIPLPALEKYLTNAGCKA